MNKIQVYRGKGKVQPWRYRVVALNGETINQSEGYFSLWNAKRAAKKAFPDTPIVRVPKEPV